jgi:acyl-CoA synthetase (AMP-forming)/AMP-acid ligase II
VLLPAPFDESALRALASLPAALRPQTMTAGPAFLERLMEVAPLKSLQSIHVGGALSDCALWDRAFRAWPEARFVHLYGSSEAEPVAHADARVSVEKSRARKLFQALFLGEFVPEIAPRLEPEGLWIAGPHVCPRYLSDDEENRRSKQEDAQGTLWHFMGDRVVRDEAGLWYAGRSGQPQEDFQLEQRVYARLESSASFVTLDSEGRWWLVGEEVQANREAIRREFPEIHDVAEARILRDRRHRARIDRSATLRKAAPWLAG